ncbi:hypothetical protein BR93DRAFT_973697 [Coniochaeta sp. PMI_546]|nr:hypothetical protein BR93DRAFT_973697 [Coniochaeta sp. PMI_546]
MSSPNANNTRPTHPENPNPYLGEHKTPQVADPPSSTNHTIKERISDEPQPPRSSTEQHNGTTPATTTKKRKRTSTLKEQFQEGHKRKRLADEAPKITKKTCLKNQANGAHAADVPNEEPASSKPPRHSTNHTTGSKPASTTISRVAKTTLSLTEQPPGGAEEQTIARKASKSVAEPSLTNKIKVTPARNLTKGKRSLPASDDEQLQRAVKKRRLTPKSAKLPETNQVKDKHATAYLGAQLTKPLRRPSTGNNVGQITAPKALPVEEPLQFATAREQRRIAREQLFAFEALKAASKAQEHEQVKPTPSANQNKRENHHPRSADTKHRICYNTKSANSQVVKKERQSSKKQLTNGEKKHRLDTEVDKPARKLSGGSNQVKVRTADAPSKTKQKPAPPTTRTNHDRGKSPAIDSDPNCKTDFDSDSEVEDELSLREKKQQLLAANKEKRLAIQAARAAKSRTPPSPPPASSVASSSRSTSSESLEPSPATTVRESITVSPSTPPVSTGPDLRARSSSSETLQHSSRDLKSSSIHTRRPECTKAAIRRFIKD